MIYAMDMFEPLYTLEGSKIFWQGYKPSKIIGGKAYLHKSYKWQIVPRVKMDEALELLNQFDAHFNYNCLCYDYKNDIIRFDEAPDFDTEREPIVGDMISVNLITKEVKKSHSNQIWHHKWLWVHPTYTGFDTYDSYLWSKLWLSKLSEPASGNLEKWQKQLEKVGLE